MTYLSYLYYYTKWSTEGNFQFLLSKNCGNSASFGQVNNSLSGLVLVIYCPFHSGKLSGLKQHHIFSTESATWAWHSGKGLSLFHVTSPNWTLDDSLPEWLTHMAGNLRLVVSWSSGKAEGLGIQFLLLWVPSCVPFQRLPLGLLISRCLDLQSKCPKRRRQKNKKFF